MSVLINIRPLKSAISESPWAPLNYGAGPIDQSWLPINRNRCLNPGKYSHYLERWLAEFSSHQLHVIDGSLLRSEPAAVMNTLQKFLKLTQHVDYNKLLK